MDLRHLRYVAVADSKSNTPEANHRFHKLDYATTVCSRKVKVSCFCKVGMSHSPRLIGAGEIADGTDSDERA
ncbi:hypothetical protein GCM10008012_66400 [Rhizobium anhuiense]|nr:hypothetical protein GCM10008012_66400 [Rhizobium anhuiense]